MSDTPPAHPMLSLRVQIPFWICTLIWGTTWIIIRGQLGAVPPSWSVTYRFLVAGIVMFAYAGLSREGLRLGRGGQVFAMAFGIAQFVFNFNFVYRAEQHITSGLVAVIFAMLIVPNTILARAFLGTRASPRFYLGAAVAMAGIGLLFLKEYRAAASASETVLLGIGLTVAGVLSASAANILQATPRARSWPIASLIAWGMLWGRCGLGLGNGRPAGNRSPPLLSGRRWLSRGDGVSGVLHGVFQRDPANRARPGGLFGHHHTSAGDAAFHAI
jgi:drug/metabolite transporter (DMT)-like permease